MKFVDLGLDFPEIVQDNSGPIRVYTDGSIHARYPSVTTILSAVVNEEKKKILDDWRKRIGNEQADIISARGRQRGTKVHQLIEDFFCNPEKFDTSSVMPHVLGGFKTLKSAMENNVESICFFEQNLISHTLKVGGRVDCVGFLKDGDLSIIDFKTSRRIKKATDCQDYFIQTAIYGIMLNELLAQQNRPNRIEKITIMMTADDHKTPLVFIDDLRNWETAALDTIETYWNTNEN